MKISKEEVLDMACAISLIEEYDANRKGTEEVNVKPRPKYIKPKAKVIKLYEVDQGVLINGLCLTYNPDDGKFHVSLGEDEGFPTVASFKGDGRGFNNAVYYMRTHNCGVKKGE